jgi:uncharacterized membrane protein
MADPDEVQKARELLAEERVDVLEALRAARAEGARIADEQRCWREQAAELLDRGGAAGLSVTEMAKALGLSRQWTTHLRAHAEKQALTRLRRVRPLPPGFLPPGAC